MDIKDKILNNQVAVHCTTESEAIGFMRWCRQNEIKWTSGNECSDDLSYWKTCGEETCYDVQQGRLSFFDIGWGDKQGFSIIPFSLVPVDKSVIVKVIKVNGTNRDIADRCRTTVGMELGTGEPSYAYMKKLYMSEHSPIRVKHFIVRIENLPSWVATHLVRHKIGAEPFVRSQRTDRTGSNISRDELSQGELVTMDMELNPQSCISISRKRLCGQASKETREVWRKVVEAIREVDKPLAECCVPECIYRGFCTELKPCKYSETMLFNDSRNIYISKGE